MIEAYFQDIARQFTHPVTAVAQILGFVPIVLSYFVFHYNKRSTTIVIKAISDCISAIHFLLLGQPTGFAINCVNTVRGICFSQKDRRKWASGIYMPVIFCAATVVSSVLGWSGWISLLPMAGSCLAVIGYWSTDMKKLRLLNLAGLILWIVYGVIAFSLGTIIQNTVAIVSILSTQFRIRKK